MMRNYRCFFMNRKLYYSLLVDIADISLFFRFFRALRHRWYLNLCYIDIAAFS